MLWLTKILRHLLQNMMPVLNKMSIFSSLFYRLQQTPFYLISLGLFSHWSCWDQSHYLHLKLLHFWSLHKRCLTVCMHLPHCLHALWTCLGSNVIPYHSHNLSTVSVNLRNFKMQLWNDCIVDLSCDIRVFVSCLPLKILASLSWLFFI